MHLSSFNRISLFFALSKLRSTSLEVIVWECLSCQYYGKHRQTNKCYDRIPERKKTCSTILLCLTFSPYVCFYIGKYILHLQWAPRDPMIKGQLYYEYNIGQHCFLEYFLLEPKFPPLSSFIQKVYCCPTQCGYWKSISLLIDYLKLHGTHLSLVAIFRWINSSLRWQVCTMQLQITY